MKAMKAKGLKPPEDGYLTNLSFNLLKQLGNAEPNKKQLIGYVQKMD